MLRCRYVELAVAIKVTGSQEEVGFRATTGGKFFIKSECSQTCPTQYRNRISISRYEVQLSVPVDIHGNDEPCAVVHCAHQEWSGRLETSVPVSKENINVRIVNCMYRHQIRFSVLIEITCGEARLGRGWNLHLRTENRVVAGAKQYGNRADSRS